MNQLVEHLSHSIVARARELLEDMNTLYFKDAWGGELDYAVQQSKDETYNILMEFVTRYQSERYTPQENQPLRKAEEFEILFKNPNNPSVIDKFSVPTVFVVSKEKPNFRELFQAYDIVEQEDSEHVDSVCHDATENFTPPLESSFMKCSPPLRSSKSIKLLSPPLSPFQQFLHSHDISQVEKEDETSATHEYFLSRPSGHPRNNLSEQDLRSALDSKIKKAEAAKQEELMRVQQQARETTSKVITIRKKNEEHQQALRQELELKYEETEKRRQEYLLNKMMKSRSPQIEKTPVSAIIWKPQFPVSSEYVFHSFSQSIKIIYDGCECCKEIEQICNECLACRTRHLDIEAIGKLLHNDNLLIKQKELAAQLAILVALFVLFYNQDIMLPQRNSKLTNYQKLIILNDITFCNVQRSIFAIPGLDGEPELLNLLLQSFMLLKHQVSHFNNFNMYYEICLSTRLNTLVTLEQFLKCVADKLSYPMLPDEKQIRSCLEAKKSKMQWIDEQEQLDVEYVKDELCSGLNILDTLLLFFSFEDIYQYTGKPWITSIIQGLISEAAQVLLSPEGYCQPREDDPTEVLYVELHTILCKLLSCLCCILKIDNIARDYINSEALDRVCFNSTKMEFCALMEALFNQNVLFWIEDMIEFPVATFKRFESNEMSLKPIGDSCMLPFIVCERNMTTYVNFIEVGLQLLLGSFQLDELISHSELGEIFEAALQKIPVETFVYKKTASLISQIEHRLLLPSDPNEGFVE